MFNYFLCSRGLRSLVAVIANDVSYSSESYPNRNHKNAQQKAFEACLQSFVEVSNKRVDELVRDHAREVAHLCMSLQYTQKEIDEMKNTVRCHGDRLTNTTKDVDRVTCTQREMEDGIDYITNQTHRNSLRNGGSRDRNLGQHRGSRQENFRRSTETAHRTVASNSSRRPKTVVVMFESHEDRDTILQAGRKQNRVASS